MNDKIIQLLNKKKEQDLSQEERNRVIFLENLFKDPACFFKMDILTSLSILKFLGVESKEEREVLYRELISYDTYKKVLPEQMVIIPKS